MRILFNTVRIRINAVNIVKHKPNIWIILSNADQTASLTALMLYDCYTGLQSTEDATHACDISERDQTTLHINVLSRMLLCNSTLRRNCSSNRSITVN